MKRLEYLRSGRATLEPDLPILAVELINRFYMPEPAPRAGVALKVLPRACWQTKARVAVGLRLRQVWRKLLRQGVLA